MSLSLLLSVIVLSVDPFDLPIATGYVEESIPSSLGARTLTLAYDTASYSAISNEPRILIALQLLDQHQSPVRFATYGIKMTEVGNEETLLQYDFFHAENSTLVFDIRDTDGETMVQGTREPYLNAWTVNPAFGNITINMPLEPNSTYLMHLDVIGLDNIRNLFAQDQVPSVDIYFNIDDADRGKVELVPGKLVVVPEFPYHVVLIVSVAIGSIVVMSRTRLFARMYTTYK